MRSPRR